MDINSRMVKLHVPGVSIAFFDKGEIKWTKVYGVLEANKPQKVSVDTPFHACSISKMVCAMCILRLVQEGELDLHSDVNRYLSSWQLRENEFTKQRKVTIANILSHQAGLRDIDGSFMPYKEGDAIPAALDLLRGTTAYNGEEVSVKYIPETDFSYSDAGYCILEQIVEDRLGLTIPKLAEQFIFAPLNLQKTFFFEIGEPLQSSKRIAPNECAAGHHKDGSLVEEVRACYPNLEGAALWTTPAELAAIALDLLACYHGTGGTILKKEMARLMLSPYGFGGFTGLGIFLDKDKNCFFSQGWGVGMQCKMQVYPDTQRGVVVMMNCEPGVEQNASLVGEIISHVCNGAAKKESHDN